MKTFIEWCESTHPDFTEDWKKWARNAAIAGALVGGGMGLNKMMTPAPTQTAVEKPSNFQKAFGRYKRQNQELRQKAQQLKQKGMTKGTFVHGELQTPDKWTSPDAGDYLQ